jgi:hypothetical protein
VTTDRGAALNPPPWQLRATLAWPEAEVGRAELTAALGRLLLPAAFVERVLSEVAATLAQAQRRVPNAALTVQVLMRPGAADEPPHAVWGFFGLERWPAAASCVFELYLYPEL